MNLLKKIFYKLINLNPLVERIVRYRHPQKYWQARGGETYFQEQEAVEGRTLRSQYMADQIGKLAPSSLLEIGCGYGKQLKNIYEKGIAVTGCDFSRPQLLKSREHCAGIPAPVVEADGAFLPFKSKSFTAVLSSAVILHNDYEKAQRIILEMARVSQKFLIHNEDTNISFSRYGYDFKKTYEKMGWPVLHSGPIPGVFDSEITQFTIAEVPADFKGSSPQDILLQYH